MSTYFLSKISRICFPTFGRNDPVLPKWVEFGQNQKDQKISIAWPPSSVFVGKNSNFTKQKLRF